MLRTIFIGCAVAFIYGISYGHFIVEKAGQMPTPIVVLHGIIAGITLSFLAYFTYRKTRR